MALEPFLVVKFSVDNSCQKVEKMAKSVGKIYFLSSSGAALTATGNGGERSFCERHSVFFRI